MAKDTQTLHSLLQYQVLSNSLELARILVSIGSSEARKLYNENSMNELENQSKKGVVTGKEFSLYYEPAY